MPDEEYQFVAAGFSNDACGVTAILEHMFETASSQIAAALGQLAAARQALQAVEPAALSRDELLELVSAVETDTWQRAAVMHALVAEVEARGVAAESGWPSTAMLLSERLRIGLREAAAGCGWPPIWLLGGR